MKQICLKWRSIDCYLLLIWVFLSIFIHQVWSLKLLRGIFMRLKTFDKDHQYNSISTTEIIICRKSVLSVLICSVLKWVKNFETKEYKTQGSSLLATLKVILKLILQIWNMKSKESFWKGQVEKISLEYIKICLSFISLYRLNV